MRGEGEIVVELLPTHLGTSSLVIEARLLSMQKKLSATGTTRLVRLDPATDRPCSWSGRFRAAVAPLVVPARAKG